MSNNRPKAIFYCGANGSGKSTLRQFNEIVQGKCNIIADTPCTLLPISASIVKAGSICKATTMPSKLVLGLNRLNLSFTFQKD